MYVKITKPGRWYNNYIGEIFNVSYNKQKNLYVTKILFSYYIDPEDCEEISLDQFDGKISEEFADKLLYDYYSVHNKCEINKKIMKEKWKKHDFIKKSREDELREKIEKIPYHEKYFYTLKEKTQELIKILDNKLKENK